MSSAFSKITQSYTFRLENNILRKYIQQYSSNFSFSSFILGLYLSFSMINNKFYRPLHVKRCQNIKVAVLFHITRKIDKM